jgi:type I restriction enzyme S subunit
MKSWWPTKTLGQLCQLISGQHIDAKDYNTESRGVGYLTGPSDFGPLNPVISKWTEHPKVKAKCGDVLITVKGSGVGKINLLDQDEVAISRQLMAVRVTGADPRFVHAILSSTFDHFQSLSTGAAIPGISRGQVLGLKIALPPLPEQQRIVGILDEVFDGIATAKANAEKNLQNARALFESHLQSVFTQCGEGWVERRFEDVCHKITDGTHHSPQKQFAERGPGRFPYITSKNIRNNYMDLSNVAYIERAFHDEVYARCQPSLGDVLLTKDGANTGNVTLNTIDEPFSLLSSVCLIKTNQAVVKPAFLCYHLQSSTGLNSIVGQMTGAAIKRIVLKDIKKAAIPFPPLKEQDSIVTTLNSLLAETQRLESIYQQKLATLEALKKSLLNQAFTGAL